MPLGDAEQFARDPGVVRLHEPQLGHLVGAVRVESVAAPSAKGLAAEGATVVYRCFLHEGYKGYLTIDDLEDALPAVIDRMG